VRMPIVPNRSELELVPVCIRRCKRKTMVKVRVPRESDAVRGPTTKVPKNFLLT
jgi:hypothetical protein